MAIRLAASAFIMTLAPSEPSIPSEGSTPPYDAELKAGGQLTSPTWELELFLSGAVVFAMFQLPGVIEGVVRQLEPHATATGRLVIFVASLYAKAIAFTLIATFLIHLVARAQWVALLGLHSVFPRGIRWDEMKIGPCRARCTRPACRISAASSRASTTCAASCSPPGCSS